MRGTLGQAHDRSMQQYFLSHPAAGKSVTCRCLTAAGSEPVQPVLDVSTIDLQAAPIDSTDGRVRELTAMRRAIDEMLFDLEELEGRGVDRVPASLRDRAARVFRQLSETGPRSLLPHIRVRPMMDVLCLARDMVAAGDDPAPGTFIRDAA